MIPTGTRAFEYAPARTGAVAVPPMLAREATQHVKMSSFNIFASAIMIATWIRRITNPARSHIGALPTAPRSALEAIKAMTI